MQKGINEVKFPEETVKAIHELIAKALQRAIKNGTLKQTTPK